MTAIINAERLQKAYGHTPLFDDVSFSVGERDRIGIVGRNGSGKSTLVRMLAGDEAPDDGRVRRIGDGPVARLAQEPELPEGKTALESVLDESTPAAALVVAYETACHRMAEHPDDRRAAEEVAALATQMDAQGAWSLERDAMTALSRLGIGDPFAPVGTMSGGERKRVALARALMRPAALLILDEPTNHLDIDAIEWLEGALLARAGALLLITHDRYFLDRVCDVIFEITGGTIHRHNGNYSYFLESRAQREAHQATRLQKVKGLARTELEWLRRGPKARTSKSKARIDRAHQLLDEARVTTERELRDLDFVGARLGKKIVELESVSKSFDGRVVLHDVTYRLRRRDRLGIVGPNGAGKSTILNLIAGRVEPDAGTLEVGSTVRVGYYDQASVDLDEGRRLHDAVLDVSNQIETSGGSLTAAQMLERFGFERSRQRILVSTLSGGEKRRLYLLLTLMAQPNVLLLDEPTNDLDVQTLALIEDYLDGFDGVFVVVSHDRFFLDRTVDHLLVIEPGGRVAEFPGNYSAYAESREQKARAEKQAEPARPAKRRQGTAKKKGLSFNEKRELEAIEPRIAEIEARLPAIATEMVERATEYETLSQLDAEREALEAELEVRFERWAELAERAGDS